MKIKNNRESVKSTLMYAVIDPFGSITDSVRKSRTASIKAAEFGFDLTWAEMIAEGCYVEHMKVKPVLGK